MGIVRNLSIDIETYSDVDLPKCGVYKYAESPNAELLLFGYSINVKIGGRATAARSFSPALTA